MGKIRCPKSTYLMLLLLVPLAMISKVIQYTKMPSDSFIIMDYILERLYTTDLPDDNSFAFPIRVYRNIRFLGFQTNLEWSIFCTLLFTGIVLVALLRFKRFSMDEYIFIFSSMFIIDLTVLNLNKDLIQFIVILLVYLIMKTKWNGLTKMLVSAVIFIYEAVCFRSYYILVAGLSILVYIVFYRLFKKERNTKKAVLGILSIFVLMFVGIFLSKYIMPSAYEDLVTRRDRLDSDSITAATIIINKFPNTNYFYFILNYCYNAIRMICPLELFFMGSKYSIFVIYQLYLSVNIVKGIKNMDQKTLPVISFLFAYWMTFFASESDYGTLVRHQSILIVLYLVIIKDNKEKSIKRPRLPLIKIKI